jgi:hypothetical protein
MTLLSEASFLVTPNGYKASKLYAAIPVPSEGAEEVTNGDFATDTDWSKETGVTISGGNAIFNNSTANNSGLYQAAVFQTNTQYKITAEVSNYSSGNVTAWSGSSQNSMSNASFTGNGTKTWIISTGASNGYFILSSATTNGNFNIDNVSVKEYTSGDMTVTRATTATRVNENDLVSSVASNVPRIDYTGGGCPSILLEPQRTNLLLRSQEFDNAPWGTAGSITITANNATSPDGTQNADLFSQPSSSAYRYQNLGVLSGTITTSIFVKKGSQSSIAFGFVAGSYTGGMSVIFDFDTQTFGTPTNYANFTSISATYQSYGNGWYRLNLTGTTATSTAYFYVVGSLLDSFAVNAYIFGAQVEAGAYPTSYIPTSTEVQLQGMLMC